MYICLQIPRKNNLIRKNNLVFSISKSLRCHKEGGTYLYTDIREGRDNVWMGHQGGLRWASFLSGTLRNGADPHTQMGRVSQAEDNQKQKWPGKQL